MKIEVKKFGEILTSRPAGREASLITKAYLQPGTGTEPIELDFSGVKVLTPSWVDEFVQGLRETFGDHIVYLPSENPPSLNR